jgi:hypothetical protein
MNKIPITRLGKFYSDEDLSLEGFKLYGLYDPNNLYLKYIGITTLTLKTRLKNHINSPTNQQMKDWFIALKQKKIKPIISLILKCETEEQMLNEEIKYIQKYKTECNLLNIAKGGKMGVVHHTEETKQKMRENNLGINNPFFGKKHTEECQKRRSELVKQLGTYKGSNNGNYKYNIDPIPLQQLYVFEDLSLKDVANHFGCSVANIQRLLKLHGIKKVRIEKYKKEDLLAYHNMGLTQVAIGKIFGCSKKVINKKFKKHGIT